MLKYLWTKVVFQEIPNEVSLGIAISGCRIHCPGCHSRELWEDKGTPLTIENLENLLKEQKGITTLLLLGGEHDLDTLTEIFMHFHRKIKTAWYCGLDRVPKEHAGICQYLDYYKTGHYDAELGGLDSPITNQKLYKISHLGDGTSWHTDITHLFWKHEDTTV